MPASYATAGQRCVTWAELRQAGLTPSKIKTRVARGELVRLFPRVYALGDPELVPWCREAGALRSVGPDATLGYATGTALWEMTSRRPEEIDLIVSRKVRPRPGVRIHRVGAIDPRDIRTRFQLRVTSPARAVIDFAGGASLDELEEAIARGLDRRLLSDTELRSTMSRLPRNHPGAAAVTRLLEQEGGAVMTRSGGERKLRALLLAAGLPAPISNARLHGFEVDFYWPQYGVVVELDGFGFHSGRGAFERDRRRDRILTSRGLTVVRVTGRQLRDEPLAVIASLAQVLVSRAA